ncbi:MAG: ribosomal RNA small subunit methyltransferase A [Candidatus Kerfeldbacteria bacterium]|nr:ribosomal RNA small subunit methyltransferase A [Candidatus Kerfeldbacteria bacterium]
MGRLTPNKQLGQHFLVDDTVLHTIVDTYRVDNGNGVVLEVGPGLGVLTAQLVQCAQQVTAVEFDRRFLPTLHNLQQHYPNLTIVQQDILQFDLQAHQLQPGQYDIVANLPYQITGQFFRRFLSTHYYPRRMVLLIQREVAQRLVAQPGEMSILGLAVQLWAKPRLVCTVPPQAFKPAPAVHSAIVVLDDIRQQCFVTADQETRLFQLIKLGFSKKRKLLVSNLSARIPKKALLEQFFHLGISQQARAQDLSLKQWLQLVDNLTIFMI